MTYLTALETAADHKLWKCSSSASSELSSFSCRLALTFIGLKYLTVQFSLTAQFWILKYLLNVLLTTDRLQQHSQIGKYSSCCVTVDPFSSPKLPLALLSISAINHQKGRDTSLKDRLTERKRKEDPRQQRNRKTAKWNWYHQEYLTQNRALLKQAF